MDVREARLTDSTALVARAKQGDRAAFDLLVERYTPRVFNLALRITGSREDAEDCVQEAFVRAFTALQRFRGEAAFSTWLYRVALNVANDESRRLKNRPLRASELSGADPDDPAPDLDRFARSSDPGEHDPEEAAVESERRRVVLGAIRSLPEHHRTVIVLYDLQGLSYEEIGQVLGARVGTIKSRLSRARLALKERLEPHLELLRR
jgi:RNA polymerase sigma-70 factor (ECF subfamily)